MMHQSVIAKQRSSASLLIPCQFYCSGGASEKVVNARGASPWDADMETHREKADRPQLNGLSFNNGGSLPCSQDDELDEDLDSGSQGSSSSPDSPVCPKDGLYIDTQQLIVAFFLTYCGLKDSCLHHHGVQSKALATLLRVGGDIIEKHHMAFTGMLQRLSIDSREDLQKLSEVPAFVFNDGVTNWGRIVTVISFGAFVARHLKSMHLEDCISTLAEHFTLFLMTSKKDWIIQEKGWEGFVDFFHIEDYESGLKTVLMAFSSVAFLGAGLAYMIR